MHIKLLFTHALSPLHPGTGQGVGVIDLPVAREKATGLPYLPGSSLKGALRDRCEDETLRRKVFGPDTANASDHAGAALFSDQRLLLLPVRSLVGTFAWVTSPFVLHRFRRDAQEAGKTLPAFEKDPAKPEQAFIAEGSKVVNQSDLYLEDLDLEAKVEGAVSEWAAWLGQALFPDDDNWQRILKERVVVVSDDVLSFLLDTATEVTARIKLQDDYKTVQQGGLWYEESLPAESVLEGLVAATGLNASDAKADEVMRTLATLAKHPIQLGGKATVGRGLCRLRLV